MNLLKNTPDQPYKFRTKNLFEKNYDSLSTCITNSH